MEEAQLRDRLLANEPPMDLDALLARTRAAVQADRGAVARLKRLPTWARTSLVLGVATGTAAGSVALAPRPDLAEVALIPLGLVCAGMLGAALAGVALAMRPTWRPGIPGAGWFAALAVALAAPAALLRVPLIDPGLAFTLAPEALIPATVGCFLFGSVAALAVGASWRLVEQRSAVGSLHWATAVAAAAAVGNLALVLHCPVTHLGHQLVGHVGIGIVWAALAALAAWFSSTRS